MLSIWPRSNLLYLLVASFPSNLLSLPEGSSPSSLLYLLSLAGAVGYLDPGEELGHALLRPLDAKGRRNVPQEVALRDRPVHVADHHLSTLTERE